MNSLRGLIIGAMFIGLILTLVACWWYGRRLIRNEKTDAVFGNPVRALGGWHWVISGVSTILLIWLYFSWDAARAFFPNAAGEMCQVAKVRNAVNPMRTVFPFESRLLRGTSIIDRENRQVDLLTSRLNSSNMTDDERAGFEPLVDQIRSAMLSQASPANFDAETQTALDAIADRINVVADDMATENLPESALAAVDKAASEQSEWGTSSRDEVPIDPTSKRGALFAAAAAPIKEIAKDFSRIRNQSASFLSEIEELEAKIDAQEAAAQSPEAKDFTRQLSKLLKRIDDGTIFPDGVLDNVEASLANLDDVQKSKLGGLKWIDSIAMPGGTIAAGNTGCSEQGSGRWLPKPSDTIETLMRISDPDVGYKGVPLLWYKMKPLAEMAGFLIPDFIADLVPGKYPRHNEDGSINVNLKTKVLNIATGNFASPSVPVPSGHLWDSTMRVLSGLFLGIILGVPLGLFMGLSRFAKGFFDPMIELYRPVPPLAWAPLILTIFGIQDDGKIFLLFMVAFAIMVISARTGATGTQLSKIHAAHSLGASRWQIIKKVILPNSLPEILTGIRISIGVCWGTLVAAEMLAGTTGLGFLENVARKSSDYEIIWVTIILLGVLGLLFDLVMRYIIHKTIPWRGKG